MSKVYPKRGTIYTFRQILETLTLRDSPCLLFKENNMMQNIQDSHCTAEAMLHTPHWADSLWEYQMETEEWIPVFHFSANNTISINDLIDKEPEIDPYAEKEGVLWCVPIGQPRDQYYKIVDGNIESSNGDVYPLPVFDVTGHSDHFYIRANNAGTCEFCNKQVDKRVNYRDPEEGNCRLYEICTPCRDRSYKLAREYNEWD